jgi:acetylornithine deacetylase/succinyl-diaminopimelate desuccinylase-like protein
MKGGIAMAILALEAVIAAGIGLRENVSVETVLEEECCGNGTLACRLHAYSASADAALIAEPSSLCANLADMGVMWFRVRVLLHPCSSLSDCVADVQLVIEAAPEDLALKRDVFQKIDCLAPPGALLATNSSSLPSSQLAYVTGRPELVFNVNFNDPLENEYLVEIMGHAGTASATLAAAEAFLKSIGTVPVLTRAEIMGFTLNRIWRAIKREALHLEPIRQPRQRER